MTSFFSTTEHRLKLEGNLPILLDTVPRCNRGRNTWAPGITVLRKLEQFRKIRELNCLTEPLKLHIRFLGGIQCLTNRDSSCMTHGRWGVKTESGINCLVLSLSRNDWSCKLDTVRGLTNPPRFGFRKDLSYRLFEHFISWRQVCRTITHKIRLKGNTVSSTGVQDVPTCFLLKRLS